MQSESLEFTTMSILLNLILILFILISLILRLCRKKKFSLAIFAPLLSACSWGHLWECQRGAWNHVDLCFELGKWHWQYSVFFSDTFYHGSGEGECLLVIEVAVGAASLQVTFAVKIIVVFFWWWHFQRCRVVYFSI